VTDQNSRIPPTASGPESDPTAPAEDEFANVPSSPRRHPLIALATLAVAVFLIFKLKDDVSFALSSTSPIDLGDARSVATRSDVPRNRVVRISGRADRESGVILDTQGSWQFSQFFRLLGTGDRIFVMRSSDPLSAEAAAKDVFVGRLERFSDLSFQAAIRKYFAGHVSATHFFSEASLQAALSSGGALNVADTQGDKVTLSPNDELAIDMARPGEIIIEFPKERFASADAAKAAVEKEGGQVVEVPASAPDSKVVSLVVTFPAEKRDQALSALEAVDRRMHLRPARTTQKTRVADLDADAQGLLVKTGGSVVHLPSERILAIRTLASVEIPANALLLREGDRPRNHLKSVIIAAFLLGFAVVNLLALRRRQ
jgi:hypothetical protein